MSILRFVAAGLALAVGVGCGSSEAHGSRGGDPAPDASSAVDGGPSSMAALSRAEMDSLQFMREEEKLARDVYAVLDVYGSPFANIQSSEQSHMDAILALLDHYGLDDPAAGKAPGEFTNTALRSLYVALVAQGSPSELDALAVGCAIEELDIRDIELAKADITHGDILATYDTLLLGSRNHLRAFHGKLERRGGGYTPQYIDQATFDAIVSSPSEMP